MKILNNNSEYHIYIAITAYNERYIKQTIDSALKQATYPHRLSFGVVEHRVDDGFCDLTDYANTKHITMTYAAPLGVGISRNIALCLHDDEDFILQIDAHMLFDTGWDEKIIDGFLQIAQDIESDHFIISARPPWWTVNPDGTLFFCEPHPPQFVSLINYRPEPDIVMVSMDEIQSIQADHSHTGRYYAQQSDGQYFAFVREWKGERTNCFNTLDETKHWLSLGHNNMGSYSSYGGELKEKVNGQNYHEHYLFSAHLTFGLPKFFQDIYLEPNITFGGEEPIMALRAWTRGYRIFNIGDHLMWHFNKQNVKDPEDRNAMPGEKSLIDHFHRRDAKMRIYIQEILSGNVFGYWGSTDSDALGNYEKAVGFDFKQFYRDIELVNQEIQQNKNNS